MQHGSQTTLRLPLLCLCKMQLSRGPSQMLPEVQCVTLHTYVQVLQDAGRRRQYDAARSASTSGPYAGYSSGYSSSGGGGGGFQPGVDSDDFEEAFRKWWEKAGGKCVYYACLVHGT